MEFTFSYLYDINSYSSDIHIINIFSSVSSQIRLLHTEPAPTLKLTSINSMAKIRIHRRNKLEIFIYSSLWR